MVQGKANLTDILMLGIQQAQAAGIQAFIDRYTEDI